MKDIELDQIRFCAFCPNVCRFVYPVHGIPQKESMVPSALAYLGNAVVNGFFEYTEQIAESLSRLEGARVCKEACPYHFDIPELLRSLVREYQDKVER